jgi:high-affinity iron transporter
MNLVTNRRVAGLGVALLLLMCAWVAAPARAFAEGDDLHPTLTVIENALREAREGEFDKAKTIFAGYEAAWSQVEDEVKAKSPHLYAEIEEKAGVVDLAFEKQPVNGPALVAALEGLEHEAEEYIALSPSAAAAQTPSNATPAQLLALLKETRDYAEQGNWAQAEKEIGAFQMTWLAVEGQVKTRSDADYRQTENDLARVANLVAQKSSESLAVIDRMSSRLAPYAEGNQNYGIFDAAIILLREGLEAMLVIVALLAFLKQSGNGHQTRWVWAGVAAGIALSLVIGIAIQAAFASVITPANRELIEGITSLVAAGMLIYMSYWMHSKSSTVAWNRYIQQRSTAALATGSLTGIAALAFLSIFREGAETVLFYAGMAASISLTDLLIGMGIATVLLVVLGVLLVRAGLRIPISLFFSIASVLVFYLCFKFLGVGIHALQVAGVVPATTVPFLPESSFFGLYLTLETTIPQLVLLVVAIGVALVQRLRFAEMKRATPATA